MQKEGKEGKGKCRPCQEGKVICNIPYASGYTCKKGSEIELLVDDKLPFNAIPSGIPAMQGWKDFLGWDSETTEKYWRLGLKYVQGRFGLDLSKVTYDAELGLAFLTVSPDGTVSQTPTQIENVTNVVISPVTYTGSGTYRVVHSTVKVIKTAPKRRPLVRLIEFIITFFGPVTLRGSWGKEASVTGAAVVIGGGVAFGRYTIGGEDGRDYGIDMRSWYPSHGWQSNRYYFPFTERFQINPLDRKAFGGPGIGNLTIIATATGTEYKGEQVYPWYVRNNWWFGPIDSYPEIADWDGQPGNISLIPSGVTSKCNNKNRK